MSIRRYLIFILLSVITLVTFAAALQGYRSSMNKATAVFDDELLSIAFILSTLEPKAPLNQLPQDANLAFQIWQHNEVILRTDNSPSVPIADFIEGFSERNFAGQRWQTYSSFFTPQQKWVMVAQPLSRRFELAEQVILAAVTPLIISIPLLALMIFWVVSRGLHPLTELSAALRAKKTDDFRPIVVSQSPNELVPVLDTLNQLFERLDAAFSREKRFASDAAHELRTPLSVLKINAHNLALEMSSLQLDSLNMTYLNQGVERMSHVVDQILLLNRTNPEQYSSSFTRLDITQLCQTVIASLYPQIEAKKQEIELLGKANSILGDEFSLQILLQNLISNASKYTPEKGHIRVVLSNENGGPSFCVDDSGPGIAESEYSRVFERFYRIGGDQHNSNVIGCGLGLAISKHIAELHSTSLKLAKSRDLGGLSVKVQFAGKETQIA
ncbi:MAG: two-component system sensor histidine kinase QseC [Paraglaciecola sp.]